MCDSLSAILEGAHEVVLLDLDLRGGRHDERGEGGLVRAPPLRAARRLHQHHAPHVRLPLRAALLHAPPAALALAVVRPDPRNILLLALSFSKIILTYKRC